tara:strand:- start:348 stop:1064 length:717 start_codon:yes stop_codon:yes gene_type:complete
MINVNEVYETVLAICNKENRGYITPQEFNLFANQAQNSIFYSYFYDLDTAKKRSFSSDYVSRVNLLEDKLHPFKFDTTITNGDSLSSLDSFYRLANVYYKAPNTGDQEGIIVEEISSFDRIRIQQSPLTRATIDRPMYYISADLFLTIHPGEQDPALGTYFAQYYFHPHRVNWTYVVVNDKPLYNGFSPNHRNFDLVESEKPKVINKILQYAGVLLKDNDLIQSSTAEEIKSIQTEKQ